MSTYNTIQFTKEAGIGVLLLNRPQILNILGTEVVKELNDVLPKIDADPEVSVLIITGAGKAFAAGADIKEFVESDKEATIKNSKAGNEAFLKLAKLRQPTIAMVNGFALGGGLELALACDIRLGAEEAMVGLPEVGLGIFPGFGGTQRLARLVGLGHAQELIYSAKNIPAAEAYRIGLFNHIYPLADLEEQTMKLAKQISRNAPLALQMAKELINTGVDGTLEAGVEKEWNALGDIFATADRVEGVTAFLEKRRAKFTGK